MGIFQRAHDIVQAKTNKALDAAEKPDEMLDLSYEKMLEQITQVRRALVDIAASKKRGIWMGGVVPLGYRVQDRALHIVEEQAVLAPVNAMFDGMAKRDAAAIKEPLLPGGTMVLMRDGKPAKMTIEEFADRVGRPNPCTSKGG